MKPKPIEYYELMLETLYEAQLDLNRAVDKLDIYNENDEMKIYIGRIIDLSTAMVYSSTVLERYIKNRNKED